MKPLLISLTLITASLACKSQPQLGGWLPNKSTMHVDSVMEDGVMHYVATMTFNANMVCGDSVVAKKDSVKAKASKPK